jgi:hypothetical protein
MGRLLIVEGADDAYFFDAILADVGASPASTGIVYLNGKDELKNEFGPFIKSAPFKHGAVNTYAIVKDADRNPGAAITEAHAILRAHGEPEPPPATFVPAPAGRVGRVGLLILPSATEPGDLEEVCLRTVAGGALTDRVDVFLTETEAAGGVIDYLSKRKVQTYLANKHGELCRGPGRGFVCGHFNRGHASLTTIQDFCRQLIA